MKRKKGLFIFITAAALFFGTGTLSACFLFRSPAPRGEDCAVYELNDDGQSYAVKSIKQNSENVIIKAEHEGLPVTRISRGAFSYEVNGGCANYKQSFFLDSLTIPKSVKYIETDAFWGSTTDELKYGGSLADWCEIEFGDYVINYSFYYNGTEKLTSLSLPDGVTALGKYQFAGFARLNEANLNGATEIGESAFEDCALLSSVDFGGVQTIGSCAFKDCLSLKEVTLPDCATDIPYRCFYGCGKLEKVTAGAVASLGAGAFEDCASLTDINTADFALTEIKSRCFADCSNLLTITVPAGVTKIADGAFSGCHKLVEIYNLSTLHITAGSSSHGQIALNAVYVHDTADAQSKVRVSGDFTFVLSDGVDLLVQYGGKDTAVTLPDGIDGKDYALKFRLFAENRNLTSVKLSPSVVAIERYAFASCYNLKDISDYENVKSIGEYAFSGCSALTNAPLSEKLLTVGKAAFESCRALTEINLPNGLAELPDEVFSKCEKLTTVQANPTLTAIGENAFAYCAELRTLSFPQDCAIETIGVEAFYGCRSLTAVSFPQSLKYIRYGAFRNCSALKDPTFREGLVSIAQSAFENCAVTVLNLPSTVDVSEGAFSNCKIVNITVADNNPNLKAAGNCLISIADKTLLLGTPTAQIPDDGTVTSIAHEAFYGSDIESLVLPASVTSVAYNSFSNSALKYLEIKCGSVELPDRVFTNAANLESVILPEGMTEIADNAFYSLQKLKSVKLPSTLQRIGKEAFRKCSALESVTIPDGVTELGEYAFGDCSALVEVKLSAGLKVIPEGAFRLCEKLREIDIPESVEIIDDWAFAGTYSLTNANFSANLKRLGFQSFVGGYTRVNYAGTRESWNAIERDTWNDGLATIYIKGVAPFNEEPQ